MYKILPAQFDNFLKKWTLLPRVVREEGSSLRKKRRHKMMRGATTKKGLVCRGKEADKNQHNIAINTLVMMNYEDNIEFFWDVTDTFAVKQVFCILCTLHLRLLKRKTIMGIFFLSISERSLKPSVSNNWKIRKTCCACDLCLQPKITFKCIYASYIVLVHVYCLIRGTHCQRNCSD